MSSPVSQHYTPPQDFLDYNKADDQFAFDLAEFTKQPFDFTVDAFESDIDSLAFDPTFDSTAVNVGFADNGDIISFLRSDTPTRGVPSTITISSVSESNYDSHYADSLSSYGPSASPSSQYSANSLAEIDMEMCRLGVDNSSAYGGVMASADSDTSSPGSVSLASFSPPPAYHRGSFSDYEPMIPHRLRGPASDYPQVSRYTQSVMQTTVVPANMTAQLPGVSQSPSPLHSGPEDNDPKKKYPCHLCHRRFARQFNLKTHMQTHDPNRAKPHACDHPGCGRAFSRKHDLMRHTMSIHRSGATTTGQAIGVGSGARSRCDDCGRSYVGKDSDGCDCKEVK
ncbi:hypothetical protein BXZ70DRAFT_148403 [Cristinia sonorae]|uniref:C2H2-type domain-containing protein n=1 Tax=Cristinia sonorae TaxID=1940300 RepID=A0A8K0UN88_9AGAR|nr:hypothetical protein BXZ70DRAFT_148403 [Cristinia sonorae]